MRDIYITPATLDDWRTLFPILRDYPEAEFLVDGVTQPLPETVEQAFAVRASGSPMLRFRIGRAFVVFHFFSDQEIECDVSPQDITSQIDLDALLGFVRQLGDATHKRVLITPENGRERPFITYEPDRKDFEYHEAAA